MTDTTDLAHRLKSGDSRAFDTFFKENRAWVFRKALAFLKTHEDAEEATNDVFLKLWRNIGKWDPGKAKFTTWFTVLCHREMCSIRLRLNGRKHYHGDLETDAERATLDYVPAASAQPLDAMIADETLQAIEKILCEMPSRSRIYRMSWILVNLEGYTQKEAARILNTRREIVSTYVKRCQKIIARKLND